MSSALAAFGALKNGISLHKMIQDERVEISLKAKVVLTSDTIDSATMSGAALALLVVTNNSEKPQSITDIVIDYGTVRAFRVPLLSVRMDTMGNEHISALSFAYDAFFEQQADQLVDHRILPEDIYLRQNESRSGCVFFVFKELASPEDPRLIVEIGGNKVLSTGMDNVQSPVITSS